MYDAMKAAIGCLIGLVFGISASAEPLLEGRVRLKSGDRSPTRRFSYSI